MADIPASNSFEKHCTVLKACLNVPLLCAIKSIKLLCEHCIYLVQTWVTYAFRRFESKFHVNNKITLKSWSNLSNMYLSTDIIIYH